MALRQIELEQVLRDQCLACAAAHPRRALDPGHVFVTAAIVGATSRVLRFCEVHYDMGLRTIARLGGKAAD